MASDDEKIERLKREIERREREKEIEKRERERPRPHEEDKPRKKGYINEDPDKGGGSDDRRRD